MFVNNNRDEIRAAVPLISEPFHLVLMIRGILYSMFKFTQQLETELSQVYRMIFTSNAVHPKKCFDLIINKDDQEGLVEEGCI